MKRSLSSLSSDSDDGSVKRRALGDGANCYAPHAPGNNVGEMSEYSDSDNDSDEAQLDAGSTFMEKNQFSLQGNDLAAVRNSFVKTDDMQGSSYSSAAMSMMAKMGHKKGAGLGKNQQGRVDPVEASKQRGRRGLGMNVKGFEPGSDQWDFEKEEIVIDEMVEWLPSCTLKVPPLDELRQWKQEGNKLLDISEETTFCSEQTLANILNSKSVFDHLEEEEMRKARTRSNPYETIRGVFFQNRAAMKMANMDSVLDFMFTNPKHADGKPQVGAHEPLYFADVCAGPGGFSEYVLWRKAWQVKGFGFTLRGSNDFKLEDFHAAPCELFEPFYGVGGAEGDGDVYKTENLQAFQQFVLENTGGLGVHFVMADGGFSVEGQENIQEILSKRLYLCQFLCALMILRAGGNFVCKLFDIFTPFSVGLVYLMYRAFRRVAIFKPVTSRPANSERYIVCEGKREDSMSVCDYMFELNLRMNDVWPGKEKSNEDILDIVPLNLLTDTPEFFDYIYQSNEKLGEQQVISLMKIQVFATNTSLHEMRQADTRRRCLEKWKIEDKVRTTSDRSDKPQDRFASLTKDNGNYQVTSTELTPSNLADKIKSVYDFRFVVTGSEETLLLLSFGSNGNGKWKKLEDLKCELPANTVLEVEFVTELRGEGKGQRKIVAIHVIDGLFLYGTDIRSLHHSERMDKLKLFVSLITKTTRPDMAPIRVKEFCRLEQLHEIYNKLNMVVVKGCGHIPRVVYCCHEKDNERRHITPTGILLVKICKGLYGVYVDTDPWMVALSKSQNKKYYYHTVKRTSSFEYVKEATASYGDGTKSRLTWKWSWDGSESNSSGKPQISSKSLPAEKFIQFIHNLKQGFQGGGCRLKAD